MTLPKVLRPHLALFCVLFGALSARAETYTVQFGDTVSMIAFKVYGHSAYASKIAQWNELSSSSRLRVGQKLELQEPPKFAASTWNQRERDYWIKSMEDREPHARPPSPPKPTIAKEPKTKPKIKLLPKAPETTIPEAEVTPQDSAENAFQIASDIFRKTSLADLKNGVNKNRILGLISVALEDHPDNPAPYILKLSYFVRVENWDQAGKTAQELVRLNSTYCELPLITRSLQGKVLEECTR